MPEKKINAKFHMSITFSKNIANLTASVHPLSKSVINYFVNVLGTSLSRSFLKLYHSLNVLASFLLVSTEVHIIIL